MNNTAISMPLAKASSAIAAAVATKSDMAEHIAATVIPPPSDPVLVLILSLPWATIAQMAAAVYSLLLMSEWFWKKLVRPLCEHRGWLKPMRRRVVEEWEAGNTDRAAL